MAPCTEFAYVTSEVDYRRTRIASDWAAAHAGARRTDAHRRRRSLPFPRLTWS